MYKTTFKACLLFSALMSSSAVYAAGLGKLTVSSALGQVFKAEIDLVSVKKEEIPTLSVRLASPDAFREANIDFTSFLSSLKLSMDVRADGQPYVRVTSSQPVNDPFLSMLVELDSSSGRLTREYTVLLDPPDANQPSTATAEPDVVVPAAATTPVAPVAEARTVPETVAPEIRSAAPDSASEPKTVPAAQERAGAFQVKRGDTLYRIARNVTGPGVNLNQMLIALYRANPDAFSGNNINRLKAGRIIQIPDSSQVEAVSASEAGKEIKIQMADWHGYQQKLAAVAGTAPPAAETLKQSTSGKITASVEDHPVADESPKEEVLKLSKGGDAVGKETKGQAARIRAMEEDATAKAKALSEANERIALLEKNIGEMKQLLELKNSTMADAQKHAENTLQPVPPVAKPAVDAAPEAKTDAKGDVKADAKLNEPGASEAAPVAAESKPAEPVPAPAVAKPKLAPAPAPAPIEEESSIMDMLMENIQMVGGGLAALLLGLLGYSMVQRKKKALETALDDNDEAGSSDDVDVSEPGIAAGLVAAEEEVSSPVATEANQEPAATAAIAAAAAVNIADVSAAADHEEVDPVAEADIYLNYGRDAQAEKTLTDALAKKPDYPEVLAKLLEVYSLRKDTGSFEATALSLQALSPAAPLWEKAVGLGFALDPENPLYGGKPAVAVDEGAGLVAESLPSDLPGEIQFDSSELVVSQEDGLTVRSELDHADNTIEFPSISTDQPASAEVPVALAAAPASDDSVANEIVFDTEPGIAEAAPEAGPVEVIKPALVAQSEREVVRPAGNMDGGIEFSLDDAGNMPEHTLTGSKEPGLPPLPESSMAGIDLNLNETGSAGAPPEADDKSPLWYEVATKIDLARAYQEMGDDEGAREILQEVLREGDAGQQETAQMILASM